MRSFQVLILGILLWSAETLAANPVVEMKTSVGAVRIELYADKAPKTVVNFLQYVKDGFYNGLVFHRVIDGFMIQGGGHYPDLREKKGNRLPIENEAGNGLKNELGTLAMARTSNPHSATAQFFINVADNAFLNFREASPAGYGYAVFGKVTEGMDVVEKIRAVPTGNVGMFQDVPLTPVTLLKATVVQE